MCNYISYKKERFGANLTYSIIEKLKFIIIKTI
jgi:hypothetical protein